MEEYGFGALPSPKDIRDYKLAAIVTKQIKLPETYQLTPVRIKNQGSHFTCVAHALSSLVEFFNFRDTNCKNIFSTDFIYGCRTDDDYLGEGMYLRDGLKVVQKYGDVLNSQLSGNTNVPMARKKVFADFDVLVEAAYPNRISTYYKIQSFEELKYALYTGGPVPATMAWFKTAKVGADGIYRYSNKEIQSYHAVLIIGWDKDNLIIQNSWGKTWGKNGLFYVPIGKISEVFYEFYGVTDDIGNIVKPNKIINQFSLIINFILRLFELFKMKA